MALADTANLVVALRLDDQFSGPLARAQGSLGRFSSSQVGSFKQIGRGVGQVATGFDRLATRAALAAGAGLGLVVKTAIDFEDAWAGVTKTVNETDLSKAGLSFEKLQEQFRAMAREIPVSFEELANIGAQAGALGIAAGDIENFTKVVAELGVTTNLSSDEAATALGKLGTILHLSGQEFNEFADSLVNLGNQGASTEAEIIQIANRFAAAGQAAGLSKEDILGFASAAASFGIPLEAAGSSLSRIFQQTTLNIGLSNDKAKAFADTLGVSFQNFKQAWDQDAKGTFQDFLVQLNKLGKFEQAQVLKSIGITNVRDINAIQLMSQNTKELARQLDVAHDAAGALNKEAEKRFATTRNQLARFVNIVRDTGYVIGRELLPVINDALADLTRELAKPENQKRIADFAKNLAQGARDLVAAVKRGDFNTLIDTMKGAAAIAKTAFDAFNALPGPVKQLALAAIVGNKVTGGAIGSIAKGFANILAGGLKLAFPKFDIFSRGSTPANPLFVSQVGGIGGPGGVAGGGRGFWAGVGATFGVAAAAVIAERIFTETQTGYTNARTVRQGGIPTGVNPVNVGPLVELNRDMFRAIGQLGINLGAGGDLATEIQKIPESLRSDVVNAILNNPLQQRALHLTESQLHYLDSLDGHIDRVDNSINAEGAKQSRRDAQAINEAKAGRLAQAAAARDIKLSLEQRLIQDRTFKPKLDVSGFMRLLRRTSEFGAKGRGTDIEFGRKTGRDPLGDAFVALVRRLEKPALRSVAVQGEIRRHVTALEQVQGRLLRAGNVAAARHAQQNINRLNRLIGEVDKTIPHFRRIQQEINREKVAHLGALNRMNATERDIAGSSRRTAAKDFSPSFSANVYTNITATLSTYNSLVQMARVSAIRTGVANKTGGRVF